MFQRDHYIATRLAEAADAVPNPLVHVAALDLCDDSCDGDFDEPCSPHKVRARTILAYVYAFQPAAKGDERPGRGVPCVACIHARWDSGEAVSCVFHQGATHWIIREWLPGIEVVRHRRPTRWHALWWGLRQFLLGPFKGE